MLFKVRAKDKDEEGFAILRTYNVVCSTGFVLGSYRQFREYGERKVFERAASFAKVEAIRLVDKLNAAMEYFEDDEPTADEIGYILEGIQL